MLKRTLLIFLLIISFYCIQAQTDDIQISASFSTSIDLRIDGDANVNWDIDTREEYENGFWPVERRTGFSVSSSVNFRVDIASTRMLDGTGNELPLWNLGYRIEPANSAVQAEYNNRYVWGPKDGAGESARLSGIYIASESEKTVIMPGPAGNAGGYDNNAYKIRTGISANNIRAITGQPRLIEQNITPGTYVTILTLTAYAEP